MKCCCVILNYNGCEETMQWLCSIINYSFDNIVIVDNCSTDDSYFRLKKEESEKVHVVKTEANGGYGSGNNFGMQYAFYRLDADIAMICNPDVIFDEALRIRLKQIFFSSKNVGVASAVQHDRNNKEIEMSAWSIPRIWNYIFSMGAVLKKWNRPFYYTIECLHKNPCMQVDCVAGSLLMISKKSFEATGGYDEDMFLYCEETTLGCKMKIAGYKTYCCSDVSYIHMHGVSISKNISSTVRQKKIMHDSHHVLLKKYLNANLFQLAVDSIFSLVVLFEETVKSVIRAFARRIKKC